MEETVKSKKDKSKKKGKKSKKRDRSSSSSSSSSRRSDLSASQTMRDTAKPEPSGATGKSSIKNQESFFGQQRGQQSLLMSQASFQETSPMRGKQAVEIGEFIEEHRGEIESRDAMIQQLEITIEELRSEIETYERREEEAK